MASMQDAAPIRTDTLPRALGALRLGVGPGGLTALRQSGALKVLFPRRGTDEAILVNTAGGITGGDRFGIGVEVAEGARLTVTTQACERAYAASRHEGLARLDTRLAVGGALDWLPQETILFDRCRLARSLCVDLAPAARFLMCEAVLFGRLARGEALRDARFRDRVRIRRAERPVYLDGVDLFGDVAALLDRPGTADGARAMASVVLAAEGAEAHLAALREMLPETAGCSCLAPDLLVLRALAPDGLALRRILLPVLERLSGRPLPSVWRI